MCGLILAITVLLQKRKHVYNPLTRSVLLNQTEKRRQQEENLLPEKRYFVIVPRLRIRLTSFLKKQGDILLQEKVKHPIITPVYLLCWCPFLSLFPSCANFVCSKIYPQRSTIKAPHQRITIPQRSNTQHQHTLHVLHIYTPCFALFCFVLFPIQGLCQFGSRSPHPIKTCLNKTEHVRNMSVTGRIWKKWLIMRQTASSLRLAESPNIRHRTSWMTT